MIIVFLLLAFTGAPSALYIVGPATQLRASPGATAQLPISIRALDPGWEYFYVTWRAVARDRPVLVFIVEQCRGAAHRWWEPPCQLKRDVAREYEERADVAPRSGSLVLRDLRAEDAGTYRVTVSGPQGEASTDVNLTVTDEPLSLSSPMSPAVSRAARGGFGLGNSVRLGMGGLVLCLLGLIVAEAEFPAQTTSPITPHPACLYSVTSSWHGLRTQPEPPPSQQQGTLSPWLPSTHRG